MIGPCVGISVFAEHLCLWVRSVCQFVSMSVSKYVSILVCQYVNKSCVTDRHSDKMQQLHIIILPLSLIGLSLQQINTATNVWQYTQILLSENMNMLTKNAERNWNSIFKNVTALSRAYFNTWTDVVVPIFHPFSELKIRDRRACQTVAFLTGFQLIGQF